MPQKQKELIPRPPGGAPKLEKTPPEQVGIPEQILLGILGLAGVGEPTADEYTPEGQAKAHRAWGMGEIAGAAPIGPGAAAAGMMLAPKFRTGEKLKEVLMSLLTRRTAPQLTPTVAPFVQSHPRLMSHINQIMDSAGGRVLGAQWEVPMGPGGFISNIASDSSLPTNFDKAETLAHELAHHAQAMRFAEPISTNPSIISKDAFFDTSKFQDGYQTFNNVFGYGNNPFELGARVSGLNQANRQLMQARAAEQPLLPGIASNKNIHEWSRAVGMDPVLAEKAAGEQTMRAMPVRIGAAPGGAVDPRDVDTRIMQTLSRAYAGEVRPDTGRQLELPFDPSSPNQGLLSWIQGLLGGGK